MAKSIWGDNQPRYIKAANIGRYLCAVRFIAGWWRDVQGFAQIRHTLFFDVGSWLRPAQQVGSSYQQIIGR